MTAPWWEGPLVGFDTETSGVDVDEARIVTACIVLVEADGAVVESTELLIDPGVEIPESATAIHGVTTARARAEGVPAAAGVALIARTLAAYQAEGIPLVGFNVSFDLTLLDRECRRHGMEPFVPALVCDGYVLDKQLDRYRKGKRTLTAACEHYGVDLTNAHDATADALAAVGLVRAMGRRAPFPTPQQLHAAQVGWRAEQCASLAAYFERKGEPQDVRGEWPVLPVREATA